MNVCNCRSQSRKQTWTKPFSGEGCVEKAAVQQKKQGTVPVCKERSLAFVFGLDEEA